MLTQAIALLAVCAAPSSQNPTDKELIEKMFARYDGAKSLAGTIHYTVAAGNVSASLDTALQYERPSKLYINQQKRAANPDPETPSRWLVTSDGKTFSYNIPNEKYMSAPGLRLVEPVVNQRLKVSHTIATIYTASSKSLGDRSMPLDIAIAFKGDLRYRSQQWLTRKVTGQREINGKTAYIIAGDYQAYSGAGKSGVYEMAITADGDLLFYAERMRVVAGNQGEIDVTNNWNVDLKVNGTVDAALFKVVYK